MIFHVKFSLPESDKVWEETVETPICEIYSAIAVIRKVYPNAIIIEVSWNECFLDKK